MTMTFDRAWPDVFTPAEAQRLSDLQEPPEKRRPRQCLVKAHAQTSAAIYLTAGFLGRYRSDRMGRRQILGLLIPGDHVDLSACAPGYLDHDIEAIGNATVCRMPCDRLATLHAEAPGIIQKLWRVSQLDAAITRYWIFRIGRLTGRARVANFFCEMLLRLYARGLCTLEGFELPLTQVDLAETCGMTSVHVNRMLAELREEGICTLTQGIVQVGDLARMFQTGQYSWDYLYLGPEMDQEIRRRLKGTHHRQVQNGAISRSIPVDD